MHIDLGLRFAALRESCNPETQDACGTDISKQAVPGYELFCKRIYIDRHLPCRIFRHLSQQLEGWWTSVQGSSGYASFLKCCKQGCVNCKVALSKSSVVTFSMISLRTDIDTLL